MSTTDCLLILDLNHRNKFIGTILSAIESDTTESTERVVIEITTETLGRYFII